MNVFLMKYQLDNKPNQYSCLIENEIDVGSAKALNPIVTVTGTSAAKYY